MSRTQLLSSCSVIFILVAGCGKKPPPPPTATTLHQAAVFYPDQISVLIADGAQVDGLDTDGTTALWKATRLSKIDSIRPLLIAGADPDICGQRGWTPLHCNSFCNHGREAAKIAHLLLEYGANPNAVEPEYGESVLHYAVMRSSVPLVHLLLESGADVNAKSFSGSTPLERTVSRGDTIIADLLLECGADPELRNKHGIRPIDQLNVCPSAEAMQAVFREHDADDQRRPELFKAHALTEAELEAP